MKYLRSEAKDHARTHLKGIWAAALMPYAEDLSIDEKGFRKNLRHWVDELGIDGIFIAGKQSEFFSMSIPSASARWRSWSTRSAPRPA